MWNSTSLKRKLIYEIKFNVSHLKVNKFENASRYIKNNNNNKKTTSYSNWVLKKCFIKTIFIYKEIM